VVSRSVTLTREAEKSKIVSNQTHPLNTPNLFLSLMDLVPIDDIGSGSTVIDQHPRSKEVKEVLLAYEMTRTQDRAPLTELTRILRDTFDIECSVDMVKRYLERYIAPAIYVTPEYVKRGLAGMDLNTARAKLEVAEKLRAALGRLDEDAKAGDLAALGRATIEAYGRAEESLERFEAVPNRKTESVQTRTVIDLNKSVEQLRGWAGAQKNQRESPHEPHKASSQSGEGQSTPEGESG
jgi:hypothetical protein